MPVITERMMRAEEMGAVRVKPVRRRVMRAFRWQRAFEKLMLDRERMLTLKEMASLINDIAVIEHDVYRPVTEEELKALEDDPLHGMSDAAIMYVNFMRASSTIMRAGNSLSPALTQEWMRMVDVFDDRIAKDFKWKLDLLSAHDRGEAIITNVTVGFMLENGTKKGLTLPVAAIDEKDQMEVVDMVRASLNSIIAKKAIKRSAYSKRRRMFVALQKQKRMEAEAKALLIGKSANGSTF